MADALVRRDRHAAPERSRLRVDDEVRHARTRTTSGKGAPSPVVQPSGGACGSAHSALPHATAKKAATTGDAPRMGLESTRRATSKYREPRRGPRPDAR